MAEPPDAPSPDGEAPTSPGNHVREQEAWLRDRVRARLFGDPPQRFGRFRVESKLGEGGMGAVYLAWDGELERRVAVKVLTAAADDAEAEARLRREAKALARLSHPNVVGIYEVGEENGRLFIAMEYVDGSTLREYLARTSLAKVAILRLFLDIGRGLSAAHEAGFVHRDFKPENVLVDRSGRPRVADFGLARPEGGPRAEPDERDSPVVASEPPRTATGAVLGTPAYMAPEQFAGRSSDARVDQFAFCVTLWEALFGERPFAGDTLDQLATNVALGRRRSPPPGASRQDLDEVVRTLGRGLAVAPSDRFASMQALLDALEHEVRRSRGSPRSVRRIAGWVAGGSALLLALGIGRAFLQPDSVDAPPVEEPPAPWVATSWQPTLVAEASPDDPFGVTVHRLSNGLTVFISRRKGAPQVEARTIVRAGKHHDEAPGLGVPYLAVLSTYHGGERFAGPDGRETLRLFDALGIDIGFDIRARATSFRASVPSQHFDKWVQLEADRLVAPSFEYVERDLALARDVRRAELRARGPAWSMISALSAGSADGGEPTAGIAVDGPAIAAARVRAFHERWYAPNNTALVLVGDIEVEAALASLERALGGWQPRVVPPEPVWPSSVPTFGVLPIVTAGDDWALTYGWAWPEGVSPLASRLAMAMLSERWSGWHSDETACPPMDVSTRGRQAWTTDEFGAVRVHRVSGSTGRLAELLRCPYETLRRGGPRPQEFAIQAAVLRRLLLSAAESHDSSADWIADAYVRGLDWDRLAAHSRGLLAGTPDPEMLDIADVLPPSDRIIALAETSVGQALPLRPFVDPLDVRDRVGWSAAAQALLRQPTNVVDPQFLRRGPDYDVTTDGGRPLINAACTGPLTHARVIYDLPRGLDREACSLLTHGYFARLYERRAGGAQEVPFTSLDCRTGRIELTVVDTTDAFDPRWLQPATWEGLAEQYTPPCDDCLTVEGLGAGHLYWFARMASLPEIPPRPDDRRRLMEALSGPHTTLFCGNDPSLGEAIHRPLRSDVVAAEPFAPPPIERPAVFAHEVAGGSMIEVTLAIGLPDAIANDELARRLTALALRRSLDELLEGDPGRETFGSVDVAYGKPGLPMDEATLLVDITISVPTAAEALPRAIDWVRRGRASPTAIAAALEHYETELRVARLRPPEIPDAVWSWVSQGRSEDPKLAIWSRLSTIDPQDIEGWLGELGRQPMLVTLWGDLQRAGVTDLPGFPAFRAVPTAELYAGTQRASNMDAFEE